MLTSESVQVEGDIEREDIMCLLSIFGISMHKKVKIAHRSFPYILIHILSCPKMKFGFIMNLAYNNIETIL